MPTLLKKLNESFNTSKSITEVFEPKEPFKFIESEQSEMIVDGISILGKVRGQFFVPNGESRNGRFYTKHFWESVLSRTDIQTRIKNGLMGGQIGHKDTPVSDDDWNNGTVSHKITRLWIDENGLGMGECVVFNTKAGRNLNTYLRSGTQLYTSSRASGDLKEGITIKGLPVVDEDTYYLDTFDFVKDPGFLQAKPKLIENYDSGSENMNLEDQIKQLQEGLNKLSSKFNESNSSEQVNKFQENLDNLKKQNSFLESWDKTLLETVKKMSNDELNEMINRTIKISGEIRQVSYTHEGFAYEGVFIPTKNTNLDLGKVHEALTKEKLESYPIQVISVNKSENAYFGSNGIAFLWKDRPKEVINKIKESVNNNAGILFEGVGVNLDKNINLLREYKELGSPERIKEALTKANETLPEYKKYLSLGKPEVLEKLLTATESLCDNIKPLGSNLGTIKNALVASAYVNEAYKKEIKNSKKIKLEEKVKVLSKRFDLPLESVKSALESMGEAKAINFLKTITKLESSDIKVNNEVKLVSKFSKSNDLIGRISESYHFIGGKN